MYSPCARVVARNSEFSTENLSAANNSGLSWFTDILHGQDNAIDFRTRLPDGGSKASGHMADRPQFPRGTATATAKGAPRRSLLVKLGDGRNVFSYCLRI